jgi:hypothetical protein
MAELAIALAGTLLLAGALAANQRWLDRHFLPSFLLSHRGFVALETTVRAVMALVGILLILVVRPRLGRAVARRPQGALRVAFAAALALAVSDPIVARIYRQPAQWLDLGQEPLRRSDPRLGWTFVPGRVGRAVLRDRVVDYAFDPAGYRVRRAGDVVDPRRPTALFTGESFMFGEGLTWEESIPAQVGAMLGVQSANLAVDGFATDQAFMRLQAELPRFERPVAIVSLFMPVLLERNLNGDRPHLGPGLVWLPPVHEWRLQALARLIVPYHGDRVVDRGVAVTRDVLRATIDLARARGAVPLIVVPQFGTEEEVEHTLRRRVLDEGNLPYLFVPLDLSFRRPWDRHPDARGAHAIAAAIAARLREP